MKRHFFFILLLAATLKAEVGCIDKSKHLDTWDGPDYKKYHYVDCTCPCDRYYHSYDRGLCEICMHYRAPKDIAWAPWRPELQDCN
jgi:hypothetical protein